MTLLVVLILVVLWAAVLGPLIVRKLRDEEPLGSVDSFYHELHLLERAAPKTVAPANRLATAYSAGVAPGSSGYPSVSSMPGRPSLVLLRPVGSSDGDGDSDPAGPGQPGYRRLALVPDGGPVGGYGPGVRPPTSLAARDHAYRVRQCRRRRRDILLGLLATVVVTGPLGTIHSFRTLWVFTVLSAVLLVAYMVLLVRAQQAAMARRAPRRSQAAPDAGRGSPRARNPYRAAPATRRPRRAAVPVTGPRPDEWVEDPAYLRRLAEFGDSEERWLAAEEVSPWAARAGYPGAWDDEVAVGAPAPRRVAVGG